jgi:hypothetical protein
MIIPNQPPGKSASYKAASSCDKYFHSYNSQDFQNNFN